MQVATNNIITFPSINKRADLITCDEVNIWVSALKYTEITISELKKILSKDELIKAAKFHFIKNSEEYIYGRGLLRYILSYYVGTLPAEIEFVYNEFGKPLIETLHYGNIKFNVSHSRDLITVAVTGMHDVGIDIEYIDDDLEIDEIRTNLFSKRENEFIDTLSGSAKKIYFFERWTREEAYLKGTGHGFGTDRTFSPGFQDIFLRDPHIIQKNAGSWDVKNIFIHHGYSSAIAIKNINANLRYHSCTIKY